MPKRSHKNATNNTTQNSPRNKVSKSERVREKKLEFDKSEEPVIFLDKINIEILKNIIRNPDAKSLEISKKSVFHYPLFKEGEEGEVR
jgi:hypothetical protein